MRVFNEIKRPSLKTSFIIKQLLILVSIVVLVSACNNLNENYMSRYEKYINENIDTYAYSRQNLCYIDNDSIPEFCLMGQCDAEGTIILSQHNGKVTRRDCNIYPYYIEHSGLINDGYVHNGHYDNQIIKLQNGTFIDVLLTQATWSYDQPYFVYSINHQVVDTLYGDEVSEESCPIINEVLHQTYYSKGKSRAVMENPEDDQWYVYKNLVNGYKISIWARFKDDCYTTIYLEKGEEYYVIETLADYDSFYPDNFINDTIYIDNPTHPDSTWFFNCRTVVTFADVNFDGKDELILCGSPCQGKRIKLNFFDCEDYTVYKITNDGLEQIRNVLYDKLYLGECRTDYIIDTNNQSITLISYHCAYITSKEIYWFKNGEPYKLDYIYESCYYNDSVSDRPHSTYYHYNLPADTAKFEHVEDSLYGLI